MEVSRRSFVQGALATGALAISGAAIAGCTVPDSTGGGTSSGGSASGGGAATGGRWSWSTPPAPIAESEITETYDCDICIVGAGVSGNPAALYAIKHGQKVVVLQKEPTMFVNGQAMGAWKHSYGDENGVEWNIDATLQLYANLSDGKPNLKLVRQFFEHSGEALDFLLKYITDPAPGLSVLNPNGTKYTQHVSCNWLLDGTFPSRYAGMRKFHQNIVDLAISEGAQFLFSTPAQQLVTDASGAVTGVIGKTDTGDYIKVNAAKGVILCTGDVADDQEMLEAFFPIMKDRPTLHGAACNTGDGWKMARWIGAGSDMAPCGMQLHFDPSPLSAVAPPFSAAPWLHVNQRGERFTNENQGYQALASAVTVQPGYYAFQVIDSHYLDHIGDYTNGGRGGTAEQMDAAVEAGSVLKADTIEALAEAADLPVDAFTATVARYNELVDKGSDDDFGSAIIAYNGIKDPPFYAIKRQPAILVAGLGLTCNEFGQVLKEEDGQPILGLYAAGNTMGSYYGYDYPVEGFQGTTIGHCITHGILDVMHIMGTFGDKIE
jgi:fumarate reductase flavoprotein subunit